jgi:hypothetical protein
VVEERVQGELGKASLRFIAQNGVTLFPNGQYCIACQGVSRPYLSTSCDAKSGQKTVSSFSSAGTQHAFDHGYCTRLAEQVQLAGVFLEDSCEAKSLHGSLSFIIARRLDSNMCRRVIGRTFDGKEALSRDI